MSRRRLVHTLLPLALSAMTACSAAPAGSEDDDPRSARADAMSSRDAGSTTTDAGAGDPGASDAAAANDAATDTATDAGFVPDGSPWPGDAMSDAGTDAARPDTASGGDADAGRFDVTTDAPDGPRRDAENEEPCISATFEPGAIVRPVDIIWSIDASPSMDEEITRIEAELNTFANRIGDSGLDYRVVVIGSDRDQYLAAEAHRFNEICIPPPLSAAATCPDVDSERFLHVREPIHSRAVLREAMETFDAYRSFLRPSSIKHFVFVTDDDEQRASAAEDFLALAASDDVLQGRVHAHSIVDEIGYDPSCFLDDNCSCGDARGEVYIGLSERTDGLTTSICQDDWTPIFEALEERVTDAVEVPCEFIVPDPGERYEVDYGDVVVRTTGDDGASVEQVDGAGACGPSGGWYFDDPRAPNRLHLCPASCGATERGLEVELACYWEKV